MTAPGLGARLGSAFVQVRADVSNFARTAGRQIQRGITAAARRLSWRPVTQSAQRAGLAAGQQLGNGLTRTVDGRLRDMRGRFVSEGRLAGMSFSRSFDAAFDLDLSRFGALNVLNGQLIKLASASLLAAKALPLLVALISELGVVTLAAAASIPFLIAAFQTIKGTITLAMKGVSEAISAVFDADPSKLEEALKGLTPAAAAFVKEIAKAKPALEAIQKAAQESFFRPLRDSFNKLAQTGLFADIRSAVSLIATDAGVASREVLKMVTELAKGGQIRFILGNIVELFRTFIPLLPQVASLFARLAIAAGPFVNLLAEKAVKAIEKFFGVIEELISSGQLFDLFNQSIQLISQMVGLVGNLGSIIGSVFQAAGNAGVPILDTLQRITAEIADFLASVEAQEALQGVFGLLREVGTALLSVMKPLLPVFAQLITTLLPPLLRLVSGLGLPLSRVAESFARVASTVIEKLGPSFSRLVDGVGQILSQILGALAEHMDELLPDFIKLLDEIGPELVPLIAAIVNAFLELVPILPEITKALIELMPLVVALIPVFVTMVRITTALWMAVGFLVGLLVDLAGFIVGFSVDFFINSINGLILIFEGLVAMVKIVNGVIIAMAETFVDNLQRMWTFAGEAFTGIKTAITNVIVSIGKAISSIPGLLGSFVASIGNAAARIGRAIGDGLSNIPGFAADIAGKIVGRIRGFVNSVIGSINNAIFRVASAIRVSLPYIPFLAEGAIIDQPTLAVLGERGREVVLPLDDPQRARELADQAGLSSLLGSSFGEQQAPTVQVFIGDEEITKRVDVRIKKFSRGQAREVSYGARVA